MRRLLEEEDKRETALSRSTHQLKNADQISQDDLHFDPRNSSVYDPLRSKTFSLVPKAVFLLSYADETHLKGFQSKDVVKLGDYFVETKFGSVTECNSPDFNGLDGIVGFGMPVQHQSAPPPPSGVSDMMPRSGDGISASLPVPLLFALTDPTVKDNARNHVLERRAFSFLSTDSLAELQLGGYDPDAIDGRMFLTPSITINDYVVVSLSIKFGSSELLEFTPKNPRLRYLPAILDSGTSCLVIPDSTMNGLVTESPYQRWKNLVKDPKNPRLRETFHINIAGAVFDLEFDDWWLGESNQSCVQRAPENFGGILIGDVFFRRYLVLFDLRHYPESVVIGMGKRSSQYKFAKSHPTISKIPAYKRKPVNISSETAPPRYRVPMATDRIPVHNEQMTQYYINLTVGTPGQHFTAIFDTGSSVFGIFTRCIPSAPVIGRCTFGGGATGNSGVLVESAIIILSLVVLFSVVGIFVNIWCRRRQAREEQLARAKARAVNPSNSSYGPERVVSYYGTSP
mmetsp:Transcript_47923/g.150321  ORF Transcript_47923/g.150321 Transcript_47923/m.150321 type:complete len:513 (+) Transcript_47923:337-1875(+)